MDRLAPEWFAGVSRWGSPKNGLLYSFIFGLGTMLLLATGIAPQLLAISFLITFAMGRWWWDLACTVLPWASKSIYDASPLRPSILRIPLITICGLVGVVLQLYNLFTSSLTTDITSMFAVALAYGIGTLWYTIFAARAQRKGIDLAKVLSAMPPE
jgi:amino acid permease